VIQKKNEEPKHNELQTVKGIKIFTGLALACHAERPLENRLYIFLLESWKCGASGLGFILERRSAWDLGFIVKMGVWRCVVGLCDNFAYIHMNLQTERVYIHTYLDKVRQSFWNRGSTKHFGAYT
jgi:hypothetical protein